jgi:hypothetical protein
MLECGMIGHLDPARRRGLFAALLPRLAPDAPVVFDVQPPRPSRYRPIPTPCASVAWNTKATGTPSRLPWDRLRWTMIYRTMLDGAENSHILSRSGAGC